MPEIVIDNIPVQYSGKANIMQLAKSAGVEIPGFCYHPGLSVSGNCRMCMVEVGMPAREKDGSLIKDEAGKTKISFMPKLQPACYQEPADGMVIQTKSEKVVQTRKYILQFLLANHPLDCPVCDQAGECVLQDYSFQYGFSESRFFEKKRTFKKKEFSDVITPELNRCIHCDRCSRFSKEIAKEYTFTRTGRGNSTELATLPGDKLTHNYQGNMVDICPVGALTLTDFRFKSRTWFLKHSEGICSSCGKGCNVVYAVNKENNVLRIKPRFNKDVNSYWMCDYGRLRYSFYNQNRRLDVLVSGAASNMKSAVEKMVSLIRESKTAGIIASANETLESMEALVNFNKESIKTPHVDFRVHSAQIEGDKQIKSGEVLLANDPYPNSEGARRSGLIGSGMSAVEMMKNPEKIDLLICVIDDKINENPDLMEAIAKFKNIVLLTPFTTKVDNKAAIVFPVLSAIEQGGTFINVDGLAQQFKPVLVSSGNGKPLAHIMDLLKQGLSSPGNLQKESAGIL